MNYIKHLSAFFQKASTDNLLNPSHVSLYMALFQFWNLNRFDNPISINRSQTMKLCKIGSFHTYYKCMNDLTTGGYITYHPSHNPLRGSLVYMCIFDTSSEQVLHPHIDMSNKKYDLKQTPNQNLEIMNTDNKPIGKEPKVKRRKVSQKKEKLAMPPIQAEVSKFFAQENYPELEAQKFFNHFESNGWKVSGKTPMKNWNAAARNWMLNYKKFNPSTKFNSRNPNTNKNYGEPL